MASTYLVSSNVTITTYCRSCIDLDPNKLHLGELIGQGSFGRVFVASWRGTLVAAKVIPIQISSLPEIEVLRYVTVAA